MPDHWEGSPIMSKANSSTLGALVERTIGYHAAGDAQKYDDQGRGWRDTRRSPEDQRGELLL